MRSNQSSDGDRAGQGSGPNGVTGQAGPEDIDALIDQLQAADAAMRRAVDLLARIDGTGLIEAVEGLSIDQLLGLRGRLARQDAWSVLNVAEVLADLPATTGLWADGVLSWSQVRQACAEIRHLPKADRAEVDARIKATHDDGILDAFDPTALVDAITHAVTAIRGAGAVERAEARAKAASSISIQSGFDGRISLTGDLDAVTAAPIIAAMDAAAGPPDPDEPAPLDGLPHDTEEEDWLYSDWTPTGRGRQYATALSEICSQYLAGGGDTGRRARPSCVIRVDIADVTAQHGGTIDLAVRGGLTSLTARTIEALASDADLRVVIFDGGRPLAVSEVITAKTVPTKTRVAVAARDGGCRFPGSRDPVAWTDIHHLIPQSYGGTHHPENLISTSRAPHVQTHARGWRISLDPDTAIVTYERNGITYRAVPRGSPLARCPDPSGGRDGADGDDDPADQPDEPVAARETDPADPTMPF